MIDYPACCIYCAMFFCPEKQKQFSSFVNKGETIHNIPRKPDQRLNLRNQYHKDVRKVAPNDKEALRTSKYNFSSN